MKSTEVDHVKNEPHSGSRFNVLFVVMLGMSPEEVVNQAVRMLIKNVNSEACIDSLLQEQVCSISFI